ncbi:GlxA family transcriptional regulator [Nisaea sediminum]|uniref:GlxA family transcriptional regulator n=1 Tax=Nisaea sediminum TaxID=2775867 RepID=UPI0018673A89|nr:helix-turn-helix domain-containing protein [Nisaea sediminum]
MARAPRVIPVIAVLPPRTLLLDVAGPVEVLRKANIEQDAIRFEISYVSPRPELMTSVGLPLSGLAPLPGTLPEDAMILLSGNTEETLGPEGAGEDEAAAESEIVAWLARIVGSEHKLVCICSGAVLAARAGLLDGRACTTHHSCCAQLAAIAPAARVLENRLYVEDGNRLTSAGITAGIDLMLHLVARLTEPETALAVARYLVVYLRRGGGDPQLSPWLTGRNHMHPGIHRAQDLIAGDPAHPWPVPDLARAAGVSPRHLSRLFNEHAGMSIPDYVNGLRVALARDLISQTRLDMEHVAEQAGFGSTRQLRRAWGRLHDAPPSALRRGAAQAG